MHSFATLLNDPATIAANRLQPAAGLPGFTVITTPTPVQHRAFGLLGVSHRLGHMESGSAALRPAFPQADHHDPQPIGGNFGLASYDPYFSFCDSTVRKFGPSTEASSLVTDL